MHEISLQCACSKVKASVQGFSRGEGNRIVCYCSDCQKFANQLDELAGNSEPRSCDVLNEAGGTDIVQIPIWKLQFTEGAEQVQFLNLKEGGLHRWYCDCCKTPIGNTLGKGSPFLGLIHSFVREKQSLDQDFGPVLGNVHTKSALKKVIAEAHHQKTNKILLRILRKLIWWKLRGLGKPSAFDGKL